MPNSSTTGRAMINLFDGTRRPYSDAPQILITASDGNHTVQESDFFAGPSVLLTGLPLFDNFGDDYTFLASAKGYKDTGYQPVRLAAGVDKIVDLMLVPGDNVLNFADATWKALGQSRPGLKTLFANGAASDKAAADRYSAILENNGGLVLACLLNITAAMKQILLPQGTPLDYIKQIIWNDAQFPMAQDRFFAWADPQLKTQVQQAVQQNPPQFVQVPHGLHPGATSSFKQVTFDEANVQLTLHENDHKSIDGVNCIIVEPDIDYFKNTLNHLFLEVVVNAFGSLTDPRAVYVLRWISGRRAGIAEFDPLYTLVKA
jgi:hypothetical protein